MKYASALERSDFLLADGIALQVFEKFSGRGRPENLNGTDLNPWLFTEISKTHTTSIYLYQCYDPSIGKEKDSLEKAISVLKSLFPAITFPRADQCLYKQR